MTEDAQNLQQQIQEQTANNVNDFFAKQLGQIKGELESSRSHLEDLLEQIPEQQEEARARIQELLDSYEAIVNSLDEAAQTHGVEDAVQEAVGQAQEAAGQAQEAAQQVQDAAGGATDQAQETIGQTTQQLTDRSESAQGISGKTMLVERIAEQGNTSKSEAQRFFDAFTEVVTDNLRKGEQVQITGFGKFYVQKRDARQGINPQTKQRINIPASKVPKFTAGNALKDAIKATDAVETQAEATEDDETKAFAFARVKEHQSEQPFNVGESYTLQAGIRVGDEDELPEDVVSALVSGLDLEGTKRIDILVRAEDMEIKPSWYQSYLMSTDKEPSWPEFVLTPTEPGRKQIRVDFLQQRWLAKIEFEVEVLEAKERAKAS